MESPSQLTPNSTTGSLRSRPRTSRACNVCRARKVKCDGSLPCQKCVSSRTDCIYSGGVKSRLDNNSIRPIAPKAPVPGPVSQATTEKPRSSKRTYDDPIANKKQQELRAGIGAFDRNTDAYQFYGPSSHFSFVQRLYQRIRRQSNAPLMLQVHRQVPEGLRQWGIERQIFTYGHESSSRRNAVPEGSFLPKELGEAFLSAFFTLMHPQSPVLVESEVLQTWKVLWNGPGHTPENREKFGKEKAILYMVLAIGARLTDCGDTSPSSSDDWAEHFYEHAGNPTNLFEETSLLGTHLLLLRAIYGMQIGRPNMVYLYLGHASRSAMALGLHRAQVVHGNNAFLNRLRLTFWTIFYMERMMSMFTGRPSCLLDDQIDAPYPNDFPQSSGRQSIEFAYIRAMAVLGKISEKVMTGNYSPTRTKRVSDLSEVNRNNNQCLEALQSLLDTLPPYLHFFDQKSPPGEAWQEVQRSCLGSTYHIVRILINRPALVYVTFFDSKALAQESIGDHIDIQRDIDRTVSSAKSLITLAHDSFFNRCPALRKDGNMVFFIVSACLVLLFDVLDAETTPAHATEVFHVVEKGLKCLDRIDHIGSTTGRAISLDVMKIAKDALLSTEPKTHLGSNLMESFAWLNNDVFDQAPYDTAGSWLYNSLEMPTLDYSAMGMPDFFGPSAVDLADPSDPNQMVLGLMGEGLQVANASYDPSQAGT